MDIWLQQTLRLRSLGRKLATLILASWEGKEGVEAGEVQGRVLKKFGVVPIEDQFEAAVRYLVGLRYIKPMKIPIDIHEKMFLRGRGRRTVPPLQQTYQNLLIKFKKFKSPTTRFYRGIKSYRQLKRWIRLLNKTYQNPGVYVYKRSKFEVDGRDKELKEQITRNTILSMKRIANELERRRRNPRLRAY